jgi:hypothetical protein
LNIDPPTEVCRSDYAGNAGDGSPVFPGGKCSVHWAEINDGNLVDCSGMLFQNSQVAVADIRDGTTHTLLAGERYLNPDHYETGAAGDNDQSAYIGHDLDVVRYTHDSHTPLQDRAGYAGTGFQFGGTHAGIFQVVFCDGSVRGIAYEIAPSLFKLLGHRKDGQVVDASSL